MSLIVLFTLGVTHTSARQMLNGRDLHGYFTKDVYVLKDSANVASGKTLTFGPGTIVEIATGYGFHVEGELRCNGTALEPVVFKAHKLENSLDDYYWWRGIFVKPGAQIHCEHLIISDAEMGITIEDPLSVSQMRAISFKNNYFDVKIGDYQAEKVDTLFSYTPSVPLLKKKVQLSPTEKKHRILTVSRFVLGGVTIAGLSCWIAGKNGSDTYYNRMLDAEAGNYQEYRAQKKRYDTIYSTGIILTTGAALGFCVTLPLSLFFK